MSGAAAPGVQARDPIFTPETSSPDLPTPVRGPREGVVQSGNPSAPLHLSPGILAPTKSSSLPVAVGSASSIRNLPLHPGSDESCGPRLLREPPQDPICQVSHTSTLPIRPTAALSFYLSISAQNSQQKWLGNVKYYILPVLLALLVLPICRRIGMRLAQTAAKGSGGGYYEHMKVKPKICCGHGLRGVDPRFHLERALIGSSRLSSPRKSMPWLFQVAR